MGGPKTRLITRLVIVEFVVLALIASISSAEIASPSTSTFSCKSQPNSPLGFMIPRPPVKCKLNLESRTPFQLKDGTGFTPANMAELHDHFNEIQHINSIAFLLWIEELAFADRFEILSVVANIAITEESTHLVQDLIHHVILSEKLEYTKNLTRNLESGDFLYQLAELSDDEVDDITISKSVVLRSFAKFKDEISVKFNPFFLLDLRDLINAIKSGDALGGALASILLLGELLDNLDGLKFTKMMNSAGKMVFKYGGTALSIGVSVYGIVCDIKDLVNGNMNGLETAIVIISLINNVVSIVLTIVGLFIPGVGELGALISALVGLVIELLRMINAENLAISFVMQLGTYVTLTDAEKEREKNNHKDQEPVDEELQELINKAQINLSLVGSYITFLKEHPAFEKVITPAVDRLDGDDKPIYYKDNKADLRYRVEFYAERWAPQLMIINEAGYFQERVCCTPINTKGDYVTEDLVENYKCENAIGIIDTYNRENTSTLFLLQDGNDEAFGTTDDVNIFMTEAGVKNFIGGDESDMFFIQSDRMSGFLRGGKGNDTLSLMGDKINTTSPVTVDLNGKQITFPSGYFIGVEDIEVIIGRESSPDIVIPTWTTMLIDGTGGSAQVRDEIRVPSLEQSFDLSIIVNKETKIHNEGKYGTFYYSFNESMLEANARIYIQDGIESRHVIFLKSPISDIRMISLDSTNNMTVESSETSTVFVTSFVHGNASTGYYGPTIVFPDDVVVKVNNDKIVTVIFTISSKPNPVGMIRAPPYGQTHFILSTIYGQLTGGEGDDLFLLTGESSLTHMNGQGGTNRLILNESFYPESLVEFDMSANPQRLSYNHNTKTMVQNVQQFLGREGATEYITIGCGETFVDGQGGMAGAGNEDRIQILTADCEERTALIRINNNTLVQNTALDGNFVYFISFVENVQLEFDFRQNLNHTFQLDVNITSIKNAKIDLEARTVEFESMTPGAPKLRIPLSTLDSLNDTEKELFFSQPGIITNDIAFLKPGKDGVVTAVFNLNETNWLIQGSTFGPNIFMINGDIDQMIGGEYVDMFILQNGTRMEFDGGLGTDRLIISENYEGGGPILVDFRDGQIIFEDSEINFDSIEEFVGRNGSADHIIADCKISSIDGFGGGGPDDLDIIEILSTESNCGYNLVVIIREYQDIIFGELTSSDNLTFFIQTTDGGNFDFTGAGTANQIVILPFDHDEFKTLHFSNDSNEITFEFDELYTIKILRNESAESVEFHLSPRIVSKNFVEFKVNNVGEITAIFHAGENKTTGFDAYNNIFMVSGSDQFESIVIGGRGNDTFIYANETTYGEMIGNGGLNILRILDELRDSIELEPIGLNDDDQQVQMMRYQNMSYIFGRKAYQDIVTVDCGVAVVSTNGGQDSASQDEVIVPDMNCFYDLNLVINNFTIVHNQAQNGSFFYTLMDGNNEEAEILRNSGRFEVICTNCTNYNYTTTHSIALNYNSSVISHFSTDNDTCELHLHTTEQTVRTFTLVDADPCEYPRLLFLDGFLLDTSHLGIFRMSYKANHSNVEQIIHEFKSLATAWNASIMVITEDERLMSIGAPGLDLLQNNPEVESHLIGNGGENIYILNQVNSTQVLRNTYLYLDGNGTDIVDLNQLVRRIREKAEIDNTTFLYVPQVYVDEDDVLHVLVHDEDVLLSETVFYNWRESNDLKFILSSSFMELNNTESNEYVLSPIPFNLTDGTHAIMDQVDLEDGMVIHVSKSLGSGKNTLTRSGDDVVLTNTLNLTTETDGAFTMIFKGGADMISRKQRMNLPQGVSIQFEDGVIDLDTLLDDISLLIPIDDAQELIRDEIEKEAFKFQCKIEGLHSHPKDCNKYYRCIKLNGQFTPIELPCPGDSIFCEDSMQCDVESSSCQCTPYLGFGPVLWS